MCTDQTPADADIEYLHARCKEHGLPQPTEQQEERFIMQCGKNWSDHGNDEQARKDAFELFNCSIPTY